MKSSGITLTVDRATFQRLEMMSLFLDIKINKLLKQIINDEFHRMQSRHSCVPTDYYVDE